MVHCKYIKTDVGRSGKKSKEKISNTDESYEFNGFKTKRKCRFTIFYIKNSTHKDKKLSISWV